MPKIKNYFELYNQSIYIRIFIRLYKKNKDKIMKVLLELREMDMYSNNLLIIFIVFSGDKKTNLVKILFRRLEDELLLFILQLLSKKY